MHDFPTTNPPPSTTTTQGFLSRHSPRLNWNMPPAKISNKTDDESTNILLSIFYAILHYATTIIAIVISFLPSSAAFLIGLALFIPGYHPTRSGSFFNGCFLMFIASIAGYANYWFVFKGDDLFWGCFIGLFVSAILVALPLIVALGEDIEELREGYLGWDEGSWNEEWVRLLRRGDDEESLKSGYSGETLVVEREERD